MEWGVVAGFAFFFFCTFIAIYVIPRHLLPRLARKQVKFQNKMKKKSYPESVPGWRTKMLNCPFDPVEIEELYNDLADEWDIEFPELKREDIENKLHGLMIEFLPNDKKIYEDTIDNKQPADRHIIDDFGRIIAGDHQGDEIRVVYNDKDVARPKWNRVGPTALTHESAHELDELMGVGENHRPEIYGSGGLVSRVKRKHS
jgi:hypothetical protein